MTGLDTTSAEKHLRMAWLDRARARDPRIGGANWSRHHVIFRVEFVSAPVLGQGCFLAT